MNYNVKVKICPHCGSRATPEARFYGEYKWMTMAQAEEYAEGRFNCKPELYRITCTSCDAARVAKDLRRAIAKWNTRYEGNQNEFSEAICPERFYGSEGE